MDSKQKIFSIFLTLACLFFMTGCQVKFTSSYQHRGAYHTLRMHQPSFVAARIMEACDAAIHAIKNPDNIEKSVKKLNKLGFASEGFTRQELVAKAGLVANTYFQTKQKILHIYQWYINTGAPKRIAIQKMISTINNIKHDMGTISLTMEIKPLEQFMQQQANIGAKAFNRYLNKTPLPSALAAR